jgi:Tol biopolymer transport system component
MGTDEIQRPPARLSWDGENVLYHDPEGHPMEYDLSDGNARQISSVTVGAASQLDWSPDGTLLAFVCPTPPENICLLNLASGVMENITGHLPNNDTTSVTGYNFAGWARDGRTIGLIFYFQPPSNGGRTYYIATLYVMDIQTKIATKVLAENPNAEPHHFYDPVLSPAGDSFLFSAKQGDYYGVYEVKVDGTGLRRVTPESSQFDITHPIWSPDGETFIATTPKAGISEDEEIDLPTIFDLSGNILGQIPITGGGEVISWVSGSK